MNCLAPDVVILGTHGLNYGLAQPPFLQEMVSFPIVNANPQIKAP